MSFNCMLCPPNQARLSDDVIGSVIARTETRGSHFERAGLPPRAPMGENPRRLCLKATISLDKDAAMTDRRARNRAHQAKFKLKQKSKEQNLESDVQRLRVETQQLEVERDVLASSKPLHSSSWCVAAEYFRLFRNGFASPKVFPPASSGAMHRTSQHAFLQAVAAPDVMVETGCGVETLLAEWKILTRFNKGIDLQLTSLECGRDNLIVASTRSVMHIDEDTLRIVFPHLLNDPRLGKKLLGKQLALHGRGSFGWDSSNNKLISIHYQVDMVTPLLKLLGNLDDVSRVFANANFTPEGTLVVC